jgi:hypothetical protein
MEGTYKIAGIDVHKSMLAVVVADAGQEGAFQFQRRKFTTLASGLEQLAAWLRQEGVQEAVMESTAQYWKPVWQELEGQCELFLAQAQSNRAPRGRKGDYKDAERLLRRHVAGELILSFVPNPEQRLWRTMTRSKHQLTRDRVRMQNQIESLLEDAHIKLATQVSDLLGVSSRRMLQALADGETDPARLAAMADPALASDAGTVAGCAARGAHDGSSASPDSGIIPVSTGTGREPYADPGEKHRAGAAGAPGRRPTAGGGSRIRGGFGHAGDRRSRPDGGHFRLSPRTLFLGRGLSGPGGVRGSIPQQPQSQGQPDDAASSHAGSQRGGEVQGQRIRRHLPQAGGTAGAQEGYLGHRPSSMPAHVEDSA